MTKMLLPSFADRQRRNYLSKATNRSSATVSPPGATYAGRRVAKLLGIQAIFTVTLPLAQDLP